MKRILLMTLIALSGCGQAYYRGQPVELGPSYEIKCTEVLLPSAEYYIRDNRSPIVTIREQGVQKSERIYFSPALSKPDGEQPEKCTVKIRVNGKEQEVDEKEIIWRYF